MRFLKGFGQFWYDFIIGDDWKIAAAIVSVLVVAAVVASSTTHHATWLAPIVAAAVMVAFTISLVIDVRR